MAKADIRRSGQVRPRSWGTGSPRAETPARESDEFFIAARGPQSSIHADDCLAAELELDAAALEGLAGRIAELDGLRRSGVVVVPAACRAAIRGQAALGHGDGDALGGPVRRVGDVHAL